MLFIFYCLGLIVGAIIKYAAPLPQKSSQAVTPLFNSSETNPSSIYGPPDYLKLMIPRSPNSSNIEDAKYYQYVFVSQIDSQDISEPELEEKVCEKI